MPLETTFDTAVSTNFMRAPHAVNDETYLRHLYSWDKKVDCRFPEDSGPIIVANCKRLLHKKDEMREEEREALYIVSLTARILTNHFALPACHYSRLLKTF